MTTRLLYNVKSEYNRYRKVDIETTNVCVNVWEIGEITKCNILSCLKKFSSFSEQLLKTFLPLTQVLLIQQLNAVFLMENLETQGQSVQSFQHQYVKSLNELEIPETSSSSLFWRSELSCNIPIWKVITLYVISTHILEQSNINI